MSANILNEYWVMDNPRSAIDEIKSLRRNNELLLAVRDAWLKYDACEDDIALRRYQLDDACKAFDDEATP